LGGFGRRLRAGRFCCREEKGLMREITIWPERKVGGKGIEEGENQKKYADEEEVDCVRGKGGQNWRKKLRKLFAQEQSAVTKLKGARRGKAGLEGGTSDTLRTGETY